jgi:hypothetical protein
VQSAGYLVYGICSACEACLELLITHDCILTTIYTYHLNTLQPRRFGASLTLKIVCCSSPRSLSSLSILASFRTSSLSTCSDAFGVFASSTKWLSQCGQYSSLLLFSHVLPYYYEYAYASSNSRASFRKHFLHFLQAKTMSKVWPNSWSALSWWHSAQSYHFLPT